MSKTKSMRGRYMWRCPVCGHIEYGDGPPDRHHCPVCANPIENFVREPMQSLEHDAHWTPHHRNLIMRMAEGGQSVVEGKGSVRRFLNFDDLLFLPAMIDSQPCLSEESVDTRVILGPRAAKPLRSKTPIFIAHMSFGAVSRETKLCLAEASSRAGTVATSGEGGMLPQERELADRYILQYASGRFGIREETLKQADAIEIKLGQGAKPGLGGLLPAEKLSEELAEIRGVSRGRDVYSPARHPDIHSPEDLARTIEELRLLSEGVPIGVKLVGSHIERDIDALADTKVLPDYFTVDGSEGGTGASPVFAKDHVGLPLAYALPRLCRHLERRGLRSELSVIACGGLRIPADFAKALALGADAVYSAGAIKMAMGCKYIRQCHRGMCPVGIATQDPALRTRFDLPANVERVVNFIAASTAEIASLCRVLGKRRVSDLCRDDLVALEPAIARATGVAMASEIS